CSTASAATSLAIWREVPITRSSPLASKTTARSPCDSIRGEQARAISDRTPGLATVSETRQQIIWRLRLEGCEASCLQSSCEFSLTRRTQRPCPHRRSDTSRLLQVRADLEAREAPALRAVAAPAS